MSSEETYHTKQTVFDQTGMVNGPNDRMSKCRKVRLKTQGKETCCCSVKGFCQNMQAKTRKSKRIQDSKELIPLHCSISKTSQEEEEEAYSSNVDFSILSLFSLVSSQVPNSFNNDVVCVHCKSSSTNLVSTIQYSTVDTLLSYYHYHRGYHYRHHNYHCSKPSSSRSRSRSSGSGNVFQVSTKLLLYFLLLLFLIIPSLFSLLPNFLSSHFCKYSSLSGDSNFFLFCFAQPSLPSLSSTNFPFSNGRSKRAAHYIEYNLADYCTEENWSDYPGRHRIRLEKSVKIRRPSIVDFHYNETHRLILGGSVGRKSDLPFDFDPNRNNAGKFVPIDDSQPQQSQQESTTATGFAPYCLLTFYADYGHRIYAEGFATGLINGGKDWFTETLHFRSNPDPEFSSAGTGTFSISTQKDSLTLVFEQLHQRSTFSFHLILTPFRHSADLEPYDTGECDKSREYRCSNQRCIAKYLICDHHNNCGDYSDEADHCLSKVPTGPPPTTPRGRPTVSTDFGRYPPDQSGKDYTPENGFPSPSEPSIPTFDINGNRLEPPTRFEPNGDDTIPEYVDVPLPPLIDGTVVTTGGYPGFGRGHGYYPPGYPDSINGKTAGGENGGFLKDLFAFTEETSSVVHVVRYLLGVLVIIILVTLINFMIWCLITKRDQSFMAPSGQAPVPAPTTVSVISQS